MIHAADDTTSNIVSKSISIGEGRASYRGQVVMGKGFKGCKNNTECDALLLASNSRTDTYPAITVKGDRTWCSMKRPSLRSRRKCFYMQQRGIPKAAAMSLAVNGFINDPRTGIPDGIFRGAAQAH